MNGPNRRDQTLSARVLTLVALASSMFAPHAAEAQAEPPVPAIGPGPVVDQAASLVVAQTSAPSAPAAPRSRADSADDITVTARRREESLQNAPVAVAALTGAQLQSYAIVNVSDLTKFVPGMVVGRQVTGSSASIFLRGVGSSSLSAGFDQSVSFNIDGIAMSRGREIALSQYDLRSVQVLKGPQALFFGKNSTGGVIAVDSNNPTSTFAGSVAAGYGFVGNEVYVDGFISGPITSTLGARFALHVNDVKGFFTNTSGTTADVAQLVAQPGGQFVRAPSDDRRGGSKSIAARLTLQYDPVDALHVNLKVAGTHFRDNGASDNYERKCGAGRTVPLPTSGFVDPYADCKIDGRTDHARIPVEITRLMRYSRNDGRPYTDLYSGSAVLNATYEATYADLSSITAFYGFDQKAGDDMNGQTRTIYNAQRSTMKQFSEELRAQTKLKGWLNFTVGGYYSDVDFTYNIDSYINAVPYDPVNNTYATFARNTGFKGKTLSAFIETIITPIPQIEISGGARYSHETKNSFVQFLPANRAFASIYSQGLLVPDRYRDDNVSPQVTVRWKPNDGLTLYAAYKEGFKAGGYNLSQTLLASSTVASALASGRFAAETASGFESGIRTALFDRTLHFNITIYDYKYKNLQVQFYNPTTISQVVANAGSLTVRGIESDFTYRVPAITGLDFHGAIAYNDAAYHDFIGQCYGGQNFSAGCNLLRSAAGNYNGQQFSGRTPPKAPRLAAQFGTSFDFPLTGSLSATLTGDTNYSSKYNYTDTLRPDAVQSSFARIDASLSIANDTQHWRLSLIGRNLTDKLVVTSANDMTFVGGTGTGAPLGGAAGIPSDLNAVVERGREIYVELRLKF